MKLPEPVPVAIVFATGEEIPGFTAEQMLAWGKACAAAEREACETVVEDIARKYQKAHEASLENIADECAAAIRARETT